MLNGNMSLCFILFMGGKYLYYSELSHIQSLLKDPQQNINRELCYFPQMIKCVFPFEFQGLELSRIVLKDVVNVKKKSCNKKSKLLSFEIT